MPRTRIVALFSLVLAGLVPSVVCADTFDDAVNLYLKGFDYCSTAKSALGKQDIAGARKEFARYEKIRQEAAAIDKSILSTNQRGMDSNLKFCERVRTDIEIETGRPALEAAIGACDKAAEHLKAGQAEPAQAEYQRFLTGRDQALQAAPAIKNVFSMRSSIRRCEALEPKIANSGKQAAALTVALQSAQDASEDFQTGCGQALEEVNKAPQSSAAVDSAKRALAAVKTLQKGAADDLSQLQAAAKGKPVAEQAAMDARMAKGKQCVTQLEAAVSKREQQWKASQDAVKGYLAKVNQANTTCAAVTKVSEKGITQARYDQARTDFESARKTRDDVKASLARNPVPETDESRSMNKAMATLEGCLNRSREHMKELLVVLNRPAPVAAPVAAAAAKPAAVKPPAPVAAAPAPAAAVSPAAAPPAAAPAAASVAAPAVAAAPTPAPVAAAKPRIPPLKLTGSLMIKDILPEFVVLYWSDGSKQPDKVDIRVHPTSFDKPIYFLQPAGDLNFVSEDFASHSLKANAGNGRDIDVLLKSRQRRSIETPWPTNTIATLSSNQDRMAPSFIVSIDSASYELLRFESDSKKLTFDLKNARNATKGYLLMPDYDVVAFQIGQDETQQLPVTRGGANLGTLELQGK